MFKEETAVSGTRFSLGKLPVNRAKKTDWEKVYSLAKESKLEEIPPDIVVRYYGNLVRIGAQFARPEAIVREVFVFCGPTGLGKSKRAWEEAGLDAYPKDPRTKFWDGYRGQEHVVMDEFRGSIDISHLLRWFDRYPVLVEIKGSAVVLKAKKIWITSNIHPKDWFVGLDDLTLKALLRRLRVTNFTPLGQ